MQRTNIELIDDIDQGPAERTIRFGYEGCLYEIDLSASHVEEIEEAITPWIAHARRVGGRKRIPRKTAADFSAVRKWAQERGYAVADRGPLPSEVLQAFDRAS